MAILSLVAAGLAQSLNPASTMLATTAVAVMRYQPEDARQWRSLDGITSMPFPAKEFKTLKMFTVFEWANSCRIDQPKRLLDTAIHQMPGLNS